MPIDRLVGIPRGAGGYYLITQWALRGDAVDHGWGEGGGAAVLGGEEVGLTE